jgi:alkanesulfonate monooxygenase SsuD/methylene tetrahydromethanopterin reductase-like flavin-dependent oxidoreductase (luciferase family)
MEYGVHLPLIDFGTSPSLRGLKECARAAAGLDYRFLCANDHLLFARPWLDGPTALAAVIEESRDLALATTIGLPVIRGPVQLAKTLAAIDVLSEGRLIVGVGPGSSAADYAASASLRRRRSASRYRCRRASSSKVMARASRASSTHPRNRPRTAAAQRPRLIWVDSWGSPRLRLRAHHGDG